MLTRAELVDFLVVGEESLVLTQTQCLRLAAVPTAMLLHLDEPRTLEEVASHLDELYGPAPPGRVQEVVEELVGYQLIVT